MAFFSMASLDPTYYNESFRLLLQNRPQSWVYLLQLLAGVHLTFLVGFLVGHVHYDQVSLGPKSTSLKVLAVLAIVTCLASRLGWSVLFRNPHAFLGYGRPSVSYRLAVSLVSLATTVPALFIHIAIIFITRRTSQHRPPGIGLGSSILLLILLLTTLGAYFWMVRRFLLAQDDEHYEPTVPLLLDTEPTVPSLLGHLSRAYACQKSRRPDEDEQDRSSATAGTGLASVPNTASLGANLSEPAASQPESHEAAHKRCQTLARFDYMCEQRIGPHSWLSDRLVPLVFGIYNTVLYGMVLVLINLDNRARLPSPNARCGLYAPLGGYFLCGFALKRSLRRSLFVRQYMALPAHWTRIKSVTGRVLFRHAEHGSTTTVDPRLRVHPLERRDYVAKYNDSASTCDQHWGHAYEGRHWVTSFRSQPTLLIFAFLGYSDYLFAKGSQCVLDYPDRVEEFDKFPDLTLADIETQRSIIYLKLLWNLAFWPFAFLVTLYSFFCGLSVLLLWSSSVNENAPAERRERDQRIRLP